MKKLSYDFIIIGGGAAGFSALIKYSELTNYTKNIALVTLPPLGGTCVNVGCVPSKKLIQIAKNIKETRIFHGDTRKPKITRILEEIKRIVEELRKNKYENIIDSMENADLYVGKAEFTGKQSIMVKNNDEELYLEAKNILIATGSKPIIPEIKGLEETKHYTTNDFWSIPEDFNNLIIIGGGPIGLEIGQAINRLGIKTTIIEMLPHLLPFTEPEIGRLIKNILIKEGVELHLGKRITSIERKNGNYIFHLKNSNDNLSTKLSFPIKDTVIQVATGRKPNTSSLKLEKAGIKTDKKGFILVDKNMKTTNPNVYAAGDVANTPKPAYLETLAAKEGSIAAENILGGNKSIDYKSVPVTIFTDPEISYVGLTERELFSIKGSCSCRAVKFSDMPKSSIIDGEGLAKIIVDPSTNTIVGFHVIAPHSSEFITQAAIMIREKYTIEKALDIIQVFPTVSEIIKYSLQAFIRRIDRMPCCVD